MNSYFVWQQDNPKMTLAAKISEAIERYRQKFGNWPVVCKVSVKEKEAVEEVDGVRVEQAKHIPLNNFWLGQP